METVSQTDGPRPRPGNRFGRRPIVTLGLVLVVLLLAVLAAVETGARILGWHHPELPPDYFASTYEGNSIGLRPGFSTWLKRVEFSHPVRINDAGFRDDRPIEALTGRDSVVFMGDSFTFGFGVAFEAMQSTRFDELLRRNGRAGVAFSTGSANGSFPPMYEYFLYREFDRLKPSVVVLGLFVGNDFIEGNDIRPRRDEAGRVVGLDVVGYELIDGRLAPSGHPEFGVDRYSRLEEHSFLFSRWAAFRRQWARERNAQAPSGDANIPEYFVAGPRETDASFHEAVRSVENIHEFVRSRGSRLLVVLIPTNFQVNGYYQEVQAGYFDFDRDSMRRSFENTQPQAWLSTHFAAKDIEFLDPLPEFRRLDMEGRRLYYPLDGHWTPEGHEVMAGLVYRELDALGWLER